MNDEAVVLDDAGVARLHQVALGLTAVDALPPAARYLDAEGVTLADRAGGVVALRRPSPWPSPEAVRTSAPLAVPPPEELPAESVDGELTLLLGTAGVRVDDARVTEWSAAWRAVATSVIEAPFAPTEAFARRAELATAYSTAGLRDVAARPQPAGPGLVVLFTGLSGSGKSTIARSVVERLRARRSVTLLDGDVVRTHLSRGLGFSRADRSTNVRRIGWVAAEVAKHGGLAVCAPIAPYDEDRRWVRGEAERSAGAGAFLLVWVSTAIEVCEGRDVKGLYAQARSGALTGFTGVDDPYEAPADADLVVDTATTSLDEATEAVVTLIENRHARSMQQSAADRGTVSP